MSKPELLSEPWQGRLDAVWTELVDEDFYSRYDGEIRRDSLVLAEQWANETLQWVGTQRLTSDLFWRHYDEASENGLSVLASLHYAARCMP